jgi:hypothetical protein
MTVTLRSSDGDEASVPATVVIPAGSSAVAFHVAAVDDQVVDGPQQVTITATTAGLPPAVETVTVTDNDVPHLTLTVTPGTFSEGAGTSAAIGTITRNTLPNTALTVTLGSSDATEATVPATITIPAGSTSVNFRVAAVEDSVTDGTQAVVVTATAVGFDAVNAHLTVTDNDVVLRLTVTPTTFGENAGPNAATATVTRSAAEPTPLTVTLTSSDTGAAAVPATVTVPANAASVTFPIAAVDDNLLNGSRGVTVRASAPGFVPSGVGLTVLDNELGVRAALPLSAISADAATSLITLRFIVPLASASAGDAASYRVTVAGQPMPVESASYDATTHRVTLALPEGRVRIGQRVVVQFKNVQGVRGENIGGRVGPVVVR